MTSRDEPPEASARLWSSAWERVTLGKVFDDSVYMTDQHVWFALTLTYIASSDPIRVDCYGDQFYKVLKRELLGCRCDRPNKRRFFPFVLGFREKGNLEGWHHHFILSIHPTLTDALVRKFGKTEVLREVFPVIKSSFLRQQFDQSRDDDLKGWLSYASNGKRNRDGIIFRQPVPSCHSKQTIRKRCLPSATQLRA